MSPDPTAAPVVPATDLIDLWIRGDAVAQTTMLILGVMSVLTWTIAVMKVVEQARTFARLRQAERVLETAESPAQILDQLPPDGPAHTLTAAGIEAVRHHRAGLDQPVDCHAWLALALSRPLTRMLGPVQGGLTALATVAASAPFVGLFGTVWSIHHALTEIGRTGHASIDRVAGPVGESLVMTALGLAVAVPALLAHNALGRRNRLLADGVRGFAAGLHARLLAGRGAGR